MSIEVVEAAPDRLLTTVAKVKTALGITTTAQDEILGDLVAAASDFVVSYTGREFALQTVRESLAGKGTPELILSLTPIIDVTLVEFDDVALDENEWTILDKEAGFIQKRTGFKSTSIPFGTIDLAPSSSYEKKWHVTYEGGYVLPGWGSSQGTRTLPYDLERAVIDMVKTSFSSLKFDGTIKSYKIGDTTVQWERGAAGDVVSALVPNSARAVLNYYRRAF